MSSSSGWAVFIFKLCPMLQNFFSGRIYCSGITLQQHTDPSLIFASGADGLAVIKQYRQGQRSLKYGQKVLEHWPKTVRFSCSRKFSAQSYTTFWP